MQVVGRRTFLSLAVSATLAAPALCAGDLEIEPLVASGAATATAATHKPRIRLSHPVVLAHGAVWLGALGIEKLKSDYWSGIDLHLRNLGVHVIAPEVSPAGSIEERARTLKEAIDRAYPGQRVNLVAHSMGGLDARFMITMMGMGDRVESLTTVSTPHHGSFYADFAKKWIFQAQGLEWLAGKTKVNAKALEELTVENMQTRFNATVSDVPGVRYYSYAGTTSIWKLPLHQWGAKLVLTLAERSAVKAAPGKATLAALDDVLPGGSRAAMELGAAARDRASWILPGEAGRSDGVVSTSSARWGTYLGEIEGHHLAQIGTSKSVDHLQLWEDVVRKLQDLGH